MSGSNLLTRLPLSHTLAKAWRGGFSVKSDFARANAEAVAAAASLGLITTIIDPRGRTFGRMWFITTKGLTQLQETK